jgi:hypothetical protein
MAETVTTTNRQGAAALTVANIVYIGGVNVLESVDRRVVHGAAQGASRNRVMEADSRTSAYTTAVGDGRNVNSTATTFCTRANDHAGHVGTAVAAGRGRTSYVQRWI